MLALPAAAPPVPRRQLLVGTALVCAAASMLVGGMLAIYLRLRMSTVDGIDPASGDPLQWVPADVSFPEVAVNIMLISFLAVFVFAQWAVYAARREQKSFTLIALGLTGLVALAIINAQAYVYQQMELPIAGGSFNMFFYAITGTFVLLMISGVAFTTVTAFRYLGGRTHDHEIVSAHALYWYFLGAAFAAIWFVVYTVK